MCLAKIPASAREDNTVNEVKDLYSDTSALKQFGTNKPLTKKELLAAREACYQFTDGTVNTDSNRTGQIVDNIIEIWDKSNGDWIQEV